MSERKVSNDELRAALAIAADALDQLWEYKITGPAYVRIFAKVHAEKARAAIEGSQSGGPETTHSNKETKT